MNVEKLNIIGNGKKWTEGLYKKEGRKDLSTLEIVTDIGKTKSVYVRLDHYLKAVTALEYAESQVLGLEVIITEGRDISRYQDGLYSALPPDHKDRAKDDESYAKRQALCTKREA